MSLGVDVVALLGRSVVVLFFVFECLMWVKRLVGLG